MNFFLNLIIFLISLFNIWKCKKSNITKATYFIIKDTKELIDSRTTKFTNLRKQHLTKNINFVRSVSYRLSFKSILTLKNIIVLNSIFEIISKKNKILNRKPSETHKEYCKILEKLFRFSNISEFKMIDDYRMLPIFLPILNRLKIDNTGYMHGRISNDLDYQKNLKIYKFNRYVVWNKYFKKKILELNSKYRNKDVLIRNPLINYTIKKISNENGICIVEEDNIKLKTYIKIINQLKNQNKFKIYFKLRPNNQINKNLINILKKNNIETFYKENIFNVLKKYNIKILLAFNSSLLIECSYYNVIPIMIYDYRPSIKEYLIDEIVFDSKIINLKKKIDNHKKLIKKLKRIKKKLWNMN